MKLLDSLLPTLNRLTGTAAPSSVQLTFSPALPPNIRQQLAELPAGTALNLTVKTATGNQITLSLPSGTTVTATINPPPSVGTQLQLNPADVLAQPTTPNPSTALPSLPAKVLPPQTGSAQPTTTQPATTPAPATPAPATPAAPPVLTQSPDSPITHTELRTLFTTTLLQQAASAAQPSTQPPTLPANVPPGPVSLIMPPKVPATLLGQPLVLTPTGPMLPDGTQTATLTPTVPTPGIPPVRTPITLTLGVPLPINKPQSATLLPTAFTISQPSQTPPPNLPILFLTGRQFTPSIPVPPTPGLQIQHPTLTNPAVALPEAEPTMPMAARILPPQPGQPQGTQSALLASGTTLILKSPQPLPIGSIIVADFPITPSSGIQRVLTADSQSQPQPNTAQHSQTAAPIATQTAQAVLTPDMVIQGTSTGQNEQGQPLLTITQPGALAGATVPLTLSDATTLLPVGAQLNIRVENNLAATILGLTLPPQTQSAYTVNTLGSQWSNLQQALSVLQQQAPLQAANLRASMPQLANLLPGLIGFTNALRTNRAEDAFDTEATRLLKSMGIDLSSDISQLSQLQQRPAAHTETQWRGTLFPYVEAPGEDPRQGGFFWRREKSDNPRSPTNTRFVVEVEMSQMGPMQLDGLITYPEIWLKLRRNSQSEPGFIEGLQTLVGGLLQTAGLSGGIAVETTSTFPVNPRSELLSQTENPLPTSA